MSRCILIWPENNLWAKKSGGRQIATGGKEKERITVQLENCKSGRKLKPVIFLEEHHHQKW